MTGTFRACIDQAGVFSFDTGEARKYAAYRQYLAKDGGCEVELSLRKRRVTRSDRQNKALHACLTEWARWLLQETGEDIDIEQMKDDLLALRWGYIVRQNRWTGEVVKSLVKPHTSRLNTQEFAELFDLAAEEAAKTGI